MDQPLYPAGAALLVEIVPGQIGQGCNVGIHPAAAGLVRRQEFRLFGQQEAALAGFGVQRVAEHQFELADDLKGMTDPALGFALIGGELEGQVGAQRQDEKQGHCQQQHQTIGGQNVPRARNPRATTRAFRFGSSHGAEFRGSPRKR